MSQRLAPPAASPSVPHGPGSGLWLAVYVVAVVYATLYPWSGWRTPGRWMFDFLSEPWPRWWTAFDVIVNVAGYLPIGLLLTAWLARRLSWPMLPAALLAGAAAIALSLELECLQALLPRRVPSRLDVLANGAGALAGALAATLAGRRRIERWPQALRTAMPLGPHAGPGLLLLAAWVLAQADPQPMAFATGDLLSAWPGSPGDPLPEWLSRWLLPVELEPFAEAAGVSMTVLAVGLLGRDLLRAPASAATWPVVLPVVAAVAIKSVASAAEAGSVGAFGWLAAGAQGGLLAGGVALLLLGWLDRRARLWLAAIALVAATVLFNLTPPNAYFLSMRAGGSGGAWLHFHALLRALALVWPYAALAWCAWRLRFAALGPRL
ncbi:MAG: VanZ family protein [Burkholderiales bacterium]|nr:VanZ family protein [Burkholderiales bacterium]